MNRKIFIRLVLLSIVNTLLFSCGTKKTSYRYDRVYPPASYAELIDGYWGEWENLWTTSYSNSGIDRYYKVQTKYNSQTLEILIYYKTKHPSDFKAKIIIDKKTGVQKDKTWTSYQGTITATIPSRLGYNESMELSGEIRALQAERIYQREGEIDNYKRKHTINCEIRCNEDMQKAIQKNGLVGTINLFYSNGKGEAIEFK